MTKDKTFQMRCSQQFLNELTALSKEMGLSRSATIELTINIYPALITLMNKHELMLAKLKEELQ